ncbi:fumarylacetoacetase [Dyadobacter jejuensis]|uniref:fumarylacetoacetase n=1 Tax=Dyadobacter jejuensis TaxID=1082580 RepID=A0A316ARE1_9BACT|nr:fumarylacetoacetase [Dyadobacter jejuensis]PWJ60001.1 fumarylacetoacetase [Dyadobacter jejuensis]
MQKRSSWLTIPDDSDFSLGNLPYGIFSRPQGVPGVGVAIGEYVIDLAMAYQKGLFADYPLAKNVFQSAVLNDFIAIGPSYWSFIRKVLQDQLCDRSSRLAQWASVLLVKQELVRLHLPLRIGNYTDFYSSREHAIQVGRLFRPERPLMPNWEHLPVAYHGRASSVVVSNTPIYRPRGQVCPHPSEGPVMQPTQELDYELELAFVVGKDSPLGAPVPVERAEEYMFGALLFNDWSARDLQRWEYQPLGPFTSKNFASTVSPWVVTMEALSACRTPAPVQSPLPLPYLTQAKRLGFDIHLFLSIQPSDEQAYPVAHTNASFLYWTVSQQVAHHTISGCNLQIGDLLATGTISGPEPGMEGCLLEATKGGTRAVPLRDGLVRRYLEDGDRVVFTGYFQGTEGRVGFGTAEGEVHPPFQLP